MKRTEVVYKVYRVVICTHCKKKLLYRQLLEDGTKISCSGCGCKMVIEGRAPQYTRRNV